MKKIYVHLFLAILEFGRIFTIYENMCERLDFNEKTNTKMISCSNRYKPFITKEYTANGTLSSFRPNSKYYLSVDGKNGLYCAETIDTFFIMPNKTDLRIIYQLKLKYASISVKIIEADDEKAKSVEEWEFHTETSDWSLFKEIASKFVKSAKIQIVASMNDKNDFSMEYLTIFNSVIALQEKKCKDLDEQFNPPATTTEISTVTSTSSTTKKTKTTKSTTTKTTPKTIPTTTPTTTTTPKTTTTPTTTPKTTTTPTTTTKTTPTTTTKTTPTTPTTTTKTTQTATIPTTITKTTTTVPTTTTKTTPTITPSTTTPTTTQTTTTQSATTPSTTTQSTTTTSTTKIPLTKTSILTTKSTHITEPITESTTVVIKPTTTESTPRESTTTESTISTPNVTTTPKITTRHSTSAPEKLSSSDEKLFMGLTLTFAILFVAASSVTAFLFFQTAAGRTIMQKFFIKSSTNQLPFRLPRLQVTSTALNRKVISGKKL